MTVDYFAVNGVVVPAEQATISVLDLGFLRGVGGFETLRTYNGHPHAVDAHLERLWESASAFGVEPFFTAKDLREIIADIRTKSGHADLRVNLIVTPGMHTSGVFGAGTPTWVVIARDVHAPPATCYTDGVTAVTFPAQRLLPQFKTTSYLVGKTGLAQAEAVGAHEAFYVNPDGHVTEGVTSNVLMVKGNDVITPIDECLPGITKRGLRPLAEAAGLTWRESVITRDDLYTADEVWITSAVRELMPVVRVDDRPIGNGTVGPWARRLRADYHAACIAEAAKDAAQATV